MIQFQVLLPGQVGSAIGQTTVLAKIMVGLWTLYAVVALRVYAYIVAVSETLVIALASGVPVIASLAVSLRKFIEARRPSIQVTVRSADRTIKLDATNIEDAERLIEIFLTEYPAEQSEPSPTPIESMEESPAERSDET